MSGSGGGGYGGGFRDDSSSCENLVIDTQVSSPKADVIASLEPGDILEVSVVQQAGTAVVVVLHHGHIAGGLASPLIQRLRECIAQGTNYSAVVQSVKEGQVRVRVAASRT